MEPICFFNQQREAQRILCALQEQIQMQKQTEGMKNIQTKQSQVCYQLQVQLLLYFCSICSNLSIGVPFGWQWPSDMN
jgi:hypothetical protein